MHSPVNFFLAARNRAALTRAIPFSSNVIDANANKSSGRKKGVLSSNPTAPGRFCRPTYFCGGRARTGTHFLSLTEYYVFFPRPTPVQWGHGHTTNLL